MLLLPPGSKLAFESRAIDARRWLARVALCRMANERLAGRGGRPITDGLATTDDENRPSLGCFATHVVFRGRLDLAPANANARHDAGRVRKMQNAKGRTRNVCGRFAAILGCTLIVLLDSQLAYADGGTLQL